MGIKKRFLAMDEDGATFFHFGKPIWGLVVNKPLGSKSGFFCSRGFVSSVNAPPKWLKPGQMWELCESGPRKGFQVWEGGVYRLVSEHLRGVICGAVSTPRSEVLDRVGESLAASIDSEMSISSKVNSPSHYTAYPLEVIDIIKLCLDEIDRRGINMTSFQKSCFKDEIKYRFRAGLKGGEEKIVEDIKKAMKYKEFRDNK